jgi:hypothetical protein
MVQIAAIWQHDLCNSTPISRELQHALRPGTDAHHIASTGSLLSESVEFVAYKKEPGRGKNCISDYGQTEACQRNDPENACGQAQIGRGLV